MGFEGSSGFHYSDCGFGSFATTTDVAIPVTQTLQTISIPQDSVLTIESFVNCKKTAGTGAGIVGEGNSYIRIIKAQNINGVVTIDTLQSLNSEAIVNDVAFDVSGTDVRLRITGSVNNTFNWSVKTKIKNGV